MLKKREYPILEFDTCKKSFTEPSELIKPIDIPECCLITFFREVVEKKYENGELKLIAELKSETLTIPVYETIYEGKRVALTLGFVGAAASAAVFEELIAFGTKKFIVCGGAGVLQKDIAVGNIVLPIAAIRDEGLSYHYLEPSREVEANKHAIQVIENEFINDGIKYIKAKTWTTDAIYRETRDKIALRVSEGCVTVEMEAAAFFAVAQFREVILGQILYGGDDLSGEAWDLRNWNSRKDTRENLVDLSMKICLKL